MMTTMMMIKKTAILVLFILFSVSCFGQNNDFGIWLGINVSHKISKKIDFDLTGCIRTFNNSSQVEQSFLEGGAQYSFSKYISLSGSYRLTNSLEDDSKYYFRHKLFIDLKSTLPYRKFSFSLRTRLQRTSKTYIEDTKDLIADYNLRLKVKTAYNIPSSPFKPYICYEMFIPVFTDSGTEISKNRFSAGIQLQLTAGSSFETEYIFQRDYQPKLADEHIVSINYKLKF